MSHPWMPLYVGDYLAETSHLSTVEHGAYLLLQMSQWQNGSLPTEDENLAIITRLPIRDWVKIKPKLIRLFADGWVHKRTASELINTSEKYERRAAAGKRGGIAKASQQALLKRSSGSATSKAPSNARAKPEQRASNAASNATSNALATEPWHCSTNSHSTNVEIPSQERNSPGSHDSQRLEPEGSRRLATPPAGEPVAINGSATAWDDDAPFGRIVGEA